MIASDSFAAFGGRVVIAVAEAKAIGKAMAIAHAEATAFDTACSRFRGDSELRRLNRQAGRWVTISPLLADALGAALRAASISDGLVDPTLGRALVSAGYDRDFKALIPEPDLPVGPTAGGCWAAVGFDPVSLRARVPKGVALDLGATAKARYADVVAAKLAAATTTGALVSAGGDLAVSGTPPDGGWLVGLAEHHQQPPASHLFLDGGGLATSGTTARTWVRGGVRQHHVIDPRTGRSAITPWRTVTVAAATAVDANVASTAAVVLGDAACGWLEARGLSALLVDRAGREHRVGGWPDAVGMGGR